MEVDEADGFGPIRTSQTAQAEKKLDVNSTIRHISRICIDFLSLVPILQSAGGETTRDKELLQIILDADGDAFLSMIPSYSDSVRHGRFNLGANAADTLLLRFSQHMGDPTYAKREQTHLEAIRFLDATMELWLQPSASDVLNKVQCLFKFYSDMVVRKKVRSWRVRYAFSCFMSSYLKRDPWQKAWNDTEVECSLPSELLPQLGSDEDIRVRFKLATISANLLSPASLADKDASTVYRELKEGLSTDLNQYVATSFGHYQVLTGRQIRADSHPAVVYGECDDYRFCRQARCILPRPRGSDELTSVYEPYRVYPQGSRCTYGFQEVLYPIRMLLEPNRLFHPQQQLRSI